MDQGDYDAAFGAPELPPPSSNGLGLAGFIVSLLGVFCVCLSPIGLVLSLVGLSRRPRGFAIAGTVLGAIGLALGCGLGTYFAISFKDLMPVISDGYVLTGQIEEYKRAHGGAAPTDLTQVPGIPSRGLSDPWGHPYHYTLSDEGRKLELVSDGPDGQADTADDVHVTIDNGSLRGHSGRSPSWMR